MGEGAWASHCSVLSEGYISNNDLAMSSTERAARHTIRHLSHASIVYPAADVPSGQAVSPEPSFLV